MSDLVDPKPIGDRQLLDSRHHFGDSRGKFGRKLIQIMQNWRETHRKKDAYDKTHSGDDEKDRCCLRWPLSADIGLHDAADDRHQNCGKQSADINKDDLFHQQPRKRKGQQNRKGEENMSANKTAGSFLVRSQLGSFWQMLILLNNKYLDVDIMPLCGLAEGVQNMVQPGKDGFYRFL